jgi:phosphatidylglycerophosphatase A
MRTVNRDAVGWLPKARGNESAAQRFGDVAAWIISLWFGCGLVPKAPGTAGTVGALPVYWLLRGYGFRIQVVSAVAVTLVGVVASSRIARICGQKDPQCICVDEVAGVLITWLAAPPSWTGVLVGFVMFRVFDSWKPFPARALEKLPGGLGIVMDDVAAGGWAAAVLLLLRGMHWL